MARLEANPSAARWDPAWPQGRSIGRGAGIFLAATLGLTWTLWALMWISGGLLFRPAANWFIVASLYVPLIGVVLARVCGDHDALRLTGVGRLGPWHWYLVTYLLIPALLILGALFAVLVGVQGMLNLESALMLLRVNFAVAGGSGALPTGVVNGIIGISHFVLGPLLYLPLTLGAEMGWRGYLWARLRRFGPRRAALLVGILWSLSYVPLVAMGHRYPDAPVLGPVVMAAYGVVYGVILAWLRARSGSVWPSALAVGALLVQIDLIAAFFTRTSTIVGAPIGAVALVPAAVFAALLLWRGEWTLADGAAGSDAPA